MLSSLAPRTQCATLGRSAPRRAAALLTLLMLTMALAAPGASAQTNTQTNAGLGLSNIIQSVSVVNGNLVATTTQGQIVPITTTASPQQAGTGGCPILDLSLGRINLNLLGLQVTTSPICLDVNGQPGPGNLLGNLLCDIASLLNRGTPLSTILGNLTATQTATLTSGLTNLLNQALSNLNQAAVTSITPTSPTVSCPILNLSLGPLNLNLLGLQVTLNNCANPAGPVTVTVAAIPGQNNLLGNLLCTLLGGISLGTTLQGILQQVLQAIQTVLNGLP